MRSTDTHVYFVYRADYLSNFHVSHYVYNGNKFCCVEQGYQYEKAMFFGDIKIANEILLAINPYEHKRLGGMVDGFDESVWSGFRVTAMLRHCYEKFAQNADLRKLLLDTGNKTIVECQGRDQFWSCGIHIEFDTIFDETMWTGSNVLGKILSVVRRRVLDLSGLSFLEK